MTSSTQCLKACWPPPSILGGLQKQWAPFSPDHPQQMLMSVRWWRTTACPLLLKTILGGKALEVNTVYSFCLFPGRWGEMWSQTLALFISTLSAELWETSRRQVGSCGTLEMRRSWPVIEDFDNSCSTIWRCCSKGFVKSWVLSTSPGWEEECWCTALAPTASHSQSQQFTF